jgi:N-formylglutamate amidohydrolase
MATPLFQHVPARLPLLIDVPHAGTYLPKELAARLSATALALPDTDWHVEKLYGFAAELGCGLFWATHSRYVVDLNRDPSGAALYPGADNTELCPLRTFDSQPIYQPGQEPSADECAARMQTYFQPYHQALAAELDALRARHGYVVLIDGHSIRAQVPRFFTGRLPDLNLGTADGTSCAPSLAEVAWQALGQDPRFTRVHNGRFKGGYVTRHYGRPSDGIHALQLEIAQSSYMDEDTPRSLDLSCAAPLQQVLRRLARALLSAAP